MLDTKRILQLGIGVAVGMVAYHFISKAMNRGASSNETAGAFGFRGAKPQRDALCLVSTHKRKENERSSIVLAGGRLLVTILQGVPLMLKTE
jgi:hypothetical protein